MEQLLSLANAYAQGTHSSTITLAERISGNWKLFKLMTKGRTCTARTAEAATAWFLANWPADVPWPEKVPDLRVRCPDAA